MRIDARANSADCVVAPFDDNKMLEAIACVPNLYMCIALLLFVQGIF